MLFWYTGTNTDAAAAVIRECERYENWSALCFLYVQNDEADNAALTMMNHAADSWEHTEFKSVLSRCANPENLYKAGQFYVAESPLEVPACVAGRNICMYIHTHGICNMYMYTRANNIYMYVYIYIYILYICIYIYILYVCVCVCVCVCVYQLNDLLCSLSKKEGVLDHSRVVVIMKRRLPLIKEYLEQVIKAAYTSSVRPQTQVA